MYWSFSCGACTAFVGMGVRNWFVHGMRQVSEQYSRVTRTSLEFWHGRTLPGRGELLIAQLSSNNTVHWESHENSEGPKLTRKQ